MFKKLIISLFLSLFLITAIFPKVASAAEPKWYQTTLRDWYLKVYDPSNPEDIFGERYTAAQVEWVIHGYQAYALNILFLGNTELLYCFMEGGAIGFIDCRIDQLIDSIKDLISDTSVNSQNMTVVQNNPLIDAFSGNRPISGIGYFKEKFQGGVVQEANAQGFGYGAAGPIRGLWKAARDISYFFLIIALVIMSFMIMFRIKTSPQAIITIQSALPKIILGIILITFSYAIAGLLIDLMYVVIGLIAGILVNSGLFNEDWAQMYRHLNGTSIPQFGFFALMILYLVFFMIAYIANTAVTSLISAGSIPLIVMIVVGIAVMFIFFKMGWMLIKTFVSILLTIAAGPFMILMGAMGGGGVGAWIKNLVSLLAVFPTVGLFFALSFFFLAAAMPNVPFVTDFITGNLFPFSPRASSLSGATWVPPFTPAPGGEMNFVWLFTSYALLSLGSKAAEVVKGALSGKPMAYGSAIGAPIAAAGGIVGAPFGFVGETLNIAQKSVAESTYSKLNQVIGRISGKTR